MAGESPSTRIHTRFIRASHIWSGVILCFAVIGVGLFVFAGGKMLGLALEPDGALKRGAAQQAIMDAGASLTHDVERTTRPAIERGRIIANQSATADAMARQDVARLTEICNDSIRAATEIDAVVMFDAQGKILAINTVYSDGRPIPKDRIDRIMSSDFSERGIIMQCVKNEARQEILEFQTSCDITPAFFDSSGLSVAHSVPVYDRGGKQVGVVSTRMNFERINALLKHSKPAGDAGSVWFVTDAGGFFDEDLNRGATPPIGRDELADAALMLSKHQTDEISFNKDESTYMLFRVSGLTTMEGGGIQAMLSVPDTWLQREAIASAIVGVGTPAMGGILFLTLAVLVRFQQQIRLKQSLAEQANQSKSEFLANMSHEIRTPMAAILGYSDLLNGDLANDPEQSADAIRTIQSNANHLLTIVNDILDVSKIEAGQMSVEAIQTSPTQIISEVLSLVRPRAVGKGVQVGVSYETPVPKYIQSDPTRMRQILLNLMGNAIKFTEVGSVTIRVSVDAHSQVMALSVVDTGIGMTPEQCEAISRFEAFSQADASTTRKFGGTGLGLRISNALAQMLGGGLDVKSVQGQGSTFTATIATGNLDDVAILEPDEAIAGAGDQPAKRQEKDAVDLTPDKPLQGLRILVAEDGPDNQRLINFHLKKAGAEVIICDNGRVAVDALGSSSPENLPNVVLMDMQMPEMDGYSATRCLRDGGFTLPIIALTAHAMEGDRQKCLDAGCDDFLTKPIDKQLLVKTCASWSSKRCVATCAETQVL